LISRGTSADYFSFGYPREAEQDWQRVAVQYGVREFSANPA